ncbi:MAG TPA: hypothetical protein VF883_02400 [Thermoanaerobaculia bacterium]|jgi:hypothetical protein
MPTFARVLLSLLAAALFAWSVQGDALRRVPIMRTDAVVPEAGAANLLLHDVYGTAAPEIVTCSMESAYALTARGGEYVPVWRSPEVECSAVRIGDIDGDGHPDAVVGSKPYPNGAGAIYIFEPRGFAPPRASVTLPGNAGANDVAIGNVDADPAVEIVVITNSSLYVYDAVTLALEWSTPSSGHSVGIADLEGDDMPEIVVSSGFVYDAVSRSMTWDCFCYFGEYEMLVADIDADGRDEIVGSGYSIVRVVQGDTRTWTQFTTRSETRGLAVSDVDGNGQMEIVTGEQFYTPIHGRAHDGTVLWSIPQKGYTVDAIAVGDPDGDGVSEVVWGADHYVTADDTLFVAGIASQAVEWSRVDAGFIHAAVTADLDGDGDAELITAGSLRWPFTNSSGTLVEVRDVRTGSLGQFGVNGSADAIDAGQLDGDPQLEIVLAIEHEVLVFDSLSLTRQFTTPEDSGSRAADRPMLVRNVDGDPEAEIFVSRNDRSVRVWNGATAVIQATSAPLSASHLDFAIGDVDADGALDLVVATKAGYSIFRASDLALRTHVAVTGVRRVAATTGELAVTIGDEVVVLDGATLTERWRCALGGEPTRAHYTQFKGSRWLAVGTRKTLHFFPGTAAPCAQKVTAEYPVSFTPQPVFGFTDFHLADHTGDGRPELVIAGPAFEVDLIDLASEPRGDADGDGDVDDADPAALASWFYGDGSGLDACADQSGDSALDTNDLFRLVNARHGNVAATPAVAPAAGAKDVLSLVSVSAPVGTVRVPVYVRDVAGSPLGVDRPATQRIQALGFRVTFAPASAVTAASFTPAGVLAGSPLFEESYDAAYVVSFAEAGHALSFTPDGAAPGNLIGYLDVTTSSALSPGTAITMTVDPATATLSNQAGTIVETFANRMLALQNGTITVTATCPVVSVTTSIVGNAGACTAGTGGTVTAVVGGASSASLQWGWRATPGGAITPIANATGTSYTLAGADFGGAGTKFLVVSATSSCSQAVSNELTVTISSTPDVTVNASSGVYAGSTANYASVAGQGAGATYAWTVTNGTITSGQGTRAIRYTAGASGQVGIDVVVTATGCAGSSSPHADVPVIARPAGASLLYLISPCRILDTRGGPPLASGWEQEVVVSGICGIPPGAKSIAANITVVAPSTSGYLALYPSDVIWPGTSTVNYRSGRTRANNTVVGLSANGHVTVRNAGAPTHFLIDVTGYFQ